MSAPPPPPPHGGVPKGSGLPPGKYDIFVIPEHSAGSGFLYLPSLQPNVNSFAAGFASALILVALSQSMAPAFRAWWEGFQGLGNMGLTLMVMGVGFGAWSLGRIQQGPRYGPQSYSHDGSGGYGGTGTRASGNTGAPPPPPHGNSTPPPPPPHSDPPPQPPPQQERTKNTWEGPPPEPPPPQPDPPPPRPQQRPPPPPQTPPQTPPSKPQPKRPPTPQSTNGEPQPKPKESSWERAREEMRKKEEERKAKEAEQRRRDEAARRLAELRAREVRERQQREKEKQARDQQAKERRERLDAEQRAKDLGEKLEYERRERERLEKEAKEVREAAAARAAQEAREAKEAKEREEQKQRELKEREEKRKKDAQEREERRKRLQQQREEMRKREAQEAVKRDELRKKKEEEKAKAEAEAKAKAEAEAHTQARKGTSYAFSGVGEKTSMWPNGRPAAPKSTASSSTTTTKPPPSAAPSSTPSNGSKKPPAPSAARSNVSSSKTDKTETTHSYRPYDKPKGSTPQRKKSFSSVAESESSYAASQTTARTSPPPSMRGPYSTNDPDKIVISAVYLFMNQFAKTPASQLISGVGSVTDGLILRITTEGLFIDDDVRGVPQREWDVKAWTLKLAEVWCPPHCLNQANAAPPAAKSNPLLYKMASSRARDRGAVKPLTGDDADVYLTEMLRACKDCCQNGLCDRKFKSSSIPSPTGQAGEWKAKGLHVLRATVRDQEGKRYVFVVDESEAWKLAVGVQRLRRGTQARQLSVQGMQGPEARGTLEMLGWIS